MATKFSVTSPLAQLLTAIFAVFFWAASAHAGEKNLFVFSLPQGIHPQAPLVADSNGNLFGITTSGGKNNCGALFELSLVAGNWTETTLYLCQQQQGPMPTGPLTFDKMGNLYGVAQAARSGAIVEFSRAGNGAWSESIVHQFKATEGLPNPELAWDSAGNLYGTTQVDSTGYSGEVFELSPQANGSWNETILYRFPAPDGAGMPTAGVVFDSKGNLYGPTFDGIGGETTFGAIYELSLQTGGTWKFTLIYNFSLSDGGGPYSRLVFDSNGNLYGASAQANTYGEVFELLPNSNGSWSEKTLYTFTSGSDGYYPVGAPVFDASGNLYGATIWGGAGCGQNICGTVYKLSPAAGSWKETILHAFVSANDGSEPNAGVVLDSSGNIYGTTYYGGSRYGYGTVYEITP